MNHFDYSTPTETLRAPEKALITMPKADTDTKAPMETMPFWEWLKGHKETPPYFVDAVTEYLGMDRTTQRLDPAEMQTAKYCFDHFWWVMTRGGAGHRTRGPRR